MSLRETLLAKAHRRYASEVIDDVEYWLQTITAAEAMNVTLQATNIETGKFSESKLIDMQATQLCYALVDGDGGDRMFTDSEAAFIKSIDSKTFQKLYKASERLSGKGVDVDETLGKSDSVPG